MVEVQTETPLQILLVDDEENILRSLRRLLMDEDFEVLTATSGKEGLEILKENPNVGLIVSDQRMPEMNGATFLKKARAMIPDAIRIVLTGYADLNATMDAINKGGAYRYLTKPWQDDDLLLVIREAIQRFTLVKENQRLNTVVTKQKAELEQWNDQLQYMLQEQTVEIQRKNQTLEKLNENLKKNFRSTIIAFSNLMELRDKGSESHARNVAELSIKIAMALKLSGEEIETISAGALLHDIGKIGISDIILRKDTAQMNNDEFNEYMLHSVHGQTAVDSIGDLRETGVLIRHHHEWYNGGGFPDRLSGDKEIPLGSRIIAIADYLDRTIRKLQGEERVTNALQIAKKEMGKQFDPHLFPYIEGAAKETYINLLPRDDLQEVEINPNAVKVDMLVSRDVRSGSGLLLLRKGTKLSEKSILALRRYHHMDPFKTGVFVWMKK